LGGCSVSKAVHQPKAKDLSVLNAGTSRDLVLVELGQPVVSEKDANGNQTDSSSSSRVRMAPRKPERDFFTVRWRSPTLGLSEVVTNPVEGTAGAGKEMQVKVVYDAQNKVEHVDC
jgi:hypothetical protein